MRRKVIALEKSIIVSMLREGIENALLSDVFAKAIGGHHERTNERVRSIMAHLVSDGFPIGSCKKGCYIISNMEELNNATNDLQSRADAIYERIHKLKENYANSYRSSK